MRQCVFVIGTRAQLVKVAPVLAEAHEAGLRHVVWMTGQHNESIDDLIKDFDIASHFVHPRRRKERSSIVRLMTWYPGTLLSCRRYLLDARAEDGVEPVVIVHGDTLSTFLGALAARLAGAVLVHLESGLSSGSLADPFPEEILRRLTFRLTDVALCPNNEAYARMQEYSRCRAVHTGENTLLDCVRRAIRSKAAGIEEMSDSFFVASIHRFQNIYSEKRLTKIVDELLDLSMIAPVRFILHPPTEIRLRKYGLYELLAAAPGIELSPRLPYTQFVALIASAIGVISDGGSNQEELSYLGVPTVLFRSRSERPDGMGANVVLRSDIGISIAEYARSGGLDALRRTQRVDSDLQPSKIVIATLLNIAAGAELKEHSG
ncbi:MAG: UDP-N-acetylglucosamine 2-epimerase [Wenzhouxiangellaceae bacterium]|nr:UDP-N-acetylglucosamine 2-epimerase [Wenzhouxiangellaceae bacterium]